MGASGGNNCNTDLVVKLLRQWIQESIRNRIVINTKDGSVLVYVPAGTFEMGDNNEPGCIKRNVHLSAYWIGIYCITNAQYLRFTQETGYQVPPYTKNTRGLCVPFWDGGLYIGKTDRPVTCINWADAQAYAQWAGCVLPTEAQWEKAARGPQGFVYPWGNNWDPKRCRCRQNRHENITTCLVYDYPTGVSGYGTYNQAGNVWEWCTDWYTDLGEDSPGSAATSQPVQNPQGPNTGTFRVIRGGSWWYDAPAYFRTTYRHQNDPSHCRNSLGFRIAHPA